MSSKSGFTQKIKSLYEKDSNLSRLIIVLVVVFAFFAISKPAMFLKPANFASMAIQFPEYGILAFGVALALISGGIDLSVVGISNLAGICMALILSQAIPEGASDGTITLFVILAIAVGFAIGLGCGAFNGLMISKFHLPPLLATMGAMQMFTGIAIVITEGKAVSGLVPVYSKVINYLVFGFIPVPLLMFVGVAIWVSFVLSKTNYGQKLYMMGTNAKAATFSGVNNVSVLMKTYIYSGLIAIVASLVMMGRTNSAKSDVGTAYTLQCVLICVLGGVKTEGGFGKVSGIIIAILILQIISTGLNMFDQINNFYRGLIWGIVLVLVLILNSVIEQKEQAKLMKKISAQEAGSQ